MAVKLQVMVALAMQGVMIHREATVLDYMVAGEATAVVGLVLVVITPMEDRNVRCY